MNRNRFHIEPLHSSFRAGRQVWLCLACMLLGYVTLTAAETTNVAVENASLQRANPGGASEPRDGRQNEGHSPSRVDYQSFKIVNDRNIFNLNRSPGSSASQRPRPAERPVRTESFTLVGMMSYEKGDYAAFNGTSSSFKKMFKLGDSIGGLKITDIQYDHVKLDVNGKMLELKVGNQMKRQGEGEWQMAGQAGSYPASSASSSSSSGGSGSGNEDGPVSDVLKRLMERRQQETK